MLLSQNKSNWRLWFILVFIVAMFSFRFYFGLHCPSTIEDDDEVQTYLIGLKSFTTHTWPFFGTDMQGGGATYKGQMAGPLLGLLVGLPLKLWAAPESPYLFLNLLTFLAFTFLGWYCCKRAPKLSPWFIFTWIYIAPWTTHFSTQVINQSYSIVGGVLFFVGFLESVSSLNVGCIPVSFANLLMGFGLAWVMQLHMSWVMLVPLGMFSLYAQWKSGTFKSAVLYGALGAAPLLALVLPTYVIYGFGLGDNIQGYSSLFNEGNLPQFLNVVARFLSYACFELPRFIGDHTRDRLNYLLGSPWLLVPGAFLWVAGWVQALLLLGFWFTRSSQKKWQGMKYAVLAMIGIIYVFFWFSVKPPSAHRYHEALPLAMIYSFYVWERLAAQKLWRVLGVVFLISAFVFQVGYAVKAQRDGTSVYSQYRSKMESAIEQNDYRLLAERRPYALY